MKVAALCALLAVAAAPGCGDCESRRVESQFDWRMTVNGAEETGLIVGSVGVGNVDDYQGIENAVSNPAGVTGQLVGMAEAPRHGRMRLAAFALPLPLAVGQVIAGRGHGGGWTVSSTAVAPNGINLMFEPPLSTGPDSPMLTQRLDVTSLSPLRLMVAWTHRLLDRTADLTGQLELRLKVESTICD